MQQSRQVPEDQNVFVQLNAELAGKWKVIVRPRLPLPDADYWAEIKKKLIYLEP